MNLFRRMKIEDYDQAYALWSQTEGMALSEADTREAIERYLNRNPGFSFVCDSEDVLVGTILAGHDGRRGYIYHVAVNRDRRGSGIGQELVSRSLQGIASVGITKCHIFVIADNEIGNRFWSRSGWQKRDGILLYSKHTNT